MELYRITPKRDFGAGPGWWLPGAGTTGTGQFGFVKTGFVLVYGKDHPSGYAGCNACPGAGWFGTVADAWLAASCLEAVGGERNAQAFHDLYRERKHDLDAELAVSS